MRNDARAFVVVLAVLWACGGGGGDTPGHDPGGRDQGPAPDKVITDFGHDVAFPETTPPDATADGEAVEDPGPDVPLTCPGNNGCPCVDKGDCYSGICIETMHGWVCSPQCADEASCPPGWKCVVVSGTGGDIIYGCVDPFARLCRPCQNDAECVPDVGAMPGAKYVCIEYGPEGRFCGAACAGPSDCPAGFSCEETPAGRGTAQQCVTLGGATCPCTQKYQDQGALTDCFVVNEFGTCFGERTCDTACSAATPAPEACNDHDDDCDGATDEGVPPSPCPLVNEHGTCQGQTRCIAGQEICEGSYASPEVCNGRDDNCDGATDEGYPDMDQDLIADCVDPDRDGDEVPNAQDNCPDAPNADQASCDGDATGDACDPDDDNDGVNDEADNCRCVKNADQKNTDGDVMGDACDPDDDNDGVADGQDNCPLVANADQANCDGDAMGDVCDADDDNDGAANASDNCRCLANPDQKNTDGDAMGDACDPDDDNDGVADGEDNCPLAANTDQKDMNENGVGDACDCDRDGDGVPNSGEDVAGNACPACAPCDNCPGTHNPEQTDLNKNGVGDDCEHDWDGDGVWNEDDNCPWVWNPWQEDLDGDGSGDACDCDLDADGFHNENPDCPDPEPADNCPAVSNPGQEDLDWDEVGDACDPDRDGDADRNDRDCAPDDPAISHYAAEGCNGVDDDCDGDTDEPGALGCDVYYKDGDRDAFGTAEKRCLCVAEVPFTAVVSGDCDDTNGAVFPGAPEKCNGVNDDCDGQTDEEGAADCVNYYKDFDRDGYGVGADFRCLCAPIPNSYDATVPGDCADLDPNIHPGATERCNNKDDDCDGQTDEDFSLKGQACDGVDEDQCKEGIYVCNALGTGLDCTDATATTVELCNDQDDDCDGQTDEDFPLKGQACDGPDGDDCKEGVWHCSGATLVCSDNTGTNREVCNNLDDDCDGLTDEDFPNKGQACDGPDGDLCKEGTFVCNAQGTGLDCNDNTGTNVESCNNLDDDCDGQTDEEGAADCVNYYKDFDRDGYGVGADFRCLCAPIPNSYDATVPGDCADLDPNIHPGATERCNNKDDDCDGQTDEDFPLKGEPCDGPDGDQCKEGVWTCDLLLQTGVVCTDNTDTNIETCNGADDDCDGLTDEKDAQGCTDFYYDGDRDGWGTSLFQCLCQGTGHYTAARPGDCDDTNGAVFPGAPEKCNGVNDDCDSQTDEDFPLKGKPCDGADDDLCKEGIFVCKADGSGVECTDTTGPNPETCNGQDDDCDSQTDEDFPDKGQPCDGADGDLCKEGVYFCNAQGTGLDCSDVTGTISETCNGADDDCDGQTDEDSALSMCGSVANGNPQCTGGQCVAVCNTGWYDVDRVFATGCECQQDGNDHTGNQCAAAIDIGSGSDATPGQVLKTQSGRIVPDNDVDWYKFTFTDTADTGTFSAPGNDRYRIRVHLTKPTDGTIKINVYRGGCDAGSLSCQSGNTEATDYQFYTDFEDTTNRRGERPCVTSFSPVWRCCRPGECQAGATDQDACCGGVNNTNEIQCSTHHNIRTCNDDSKTYYIKVYRASGTAATCTETEYTFEISN